MSLKGYAVMAAIGFHNYRGNNGNTNNTQAPATAAITTTATPALPTLATSLLSTTLSPAATTKTINGNKSTLIQLKQQQQQTADTVLTTILTAATKTPALSSTSDNNTSFVTPTPPRPLNPYSSSNSDHFETYGGGDDRHHLHHHQQNSGTSGSGRNIYSDSEEEEAVGPDGNDVGNELTGGRQRPVNTFYGSGFGIFHQQRSNMGGAGGGGGIALITGSGGSGLGSSSYSTGINNNVNLLLGGAMLTLITTILCVVCYCCHRNIKKRTEAAYRQQRQWLENDPNMEIYSVEQCYETSGLFVGDSMDGLATIPALHHEPPPSYDAVVAMQEQQQLLMQQQQQQLLMQQLQNNSPPPGYRSSLDVSCIITARATGLTSAVLGMGSTDTNSLAASTTNIRASTSSRTPPDGNDCNGNNRDVGPLTATTSASGGHLQQPLQQLQQPNFLRAAKQRQKNLNTANLSNFNMKKVLQAQSCCSLQRAEVENMWNAAAAALAARSNHVAADARGTASASSPTLVMNNRKLSNGHSSKANTPETFGSRYLKQQNYYRRGCPLCGKFRYDNESTLSISIESDLDNMTTVGGNSAGEGGERRRAEDSRRGHDENLNCGMETGGDGGDDDDEGEDDECSCLNSHHRQLKPQAVRNTEAISPILGNSYTSDDVHNSNAAREDIELTSAMDLNANRTVPKETLTQPTTTTSSSPSLAHNNNSNNNNDEASCSTTVKPSASSASVVLTPSTNSVTIDLDCINENGIISLDMSKIIDKTGLPTYDAALKLESSGYV